MRVAGWTELLSCGWLIFFCLPLFDIYLFAGPHHASTRIALGYLGKVYEKAGLYADAEGCLRQSLRNMYQYILPGVQGVRRVQNDSSKEQHVTSDLGPNNPMENPATATQDAQRLKERVQKDAQVLGRVYCKLEQYDHAEAMLLNNVATNHATKNMASLTSNKHQLSSLYKTVATRNTSVSTPCLSNKSITTIPFSRRQLQQMRIKFGLASIEYQSALESNNRMSSS